MPRQTCRENPRLLQKIAGFFSQPLENSRLGENHRVLGKAKFLGHPRGRHALDAEPPECGPGRRAEVAFNDRQQSLNDVIVVIAVPLESEFVVRIGESLEESFRRIKPNRRPPALFFPVTPDLAYRHLPEPGSERSFTPPIETGDLATGVPLVERSLAGNPRNAHAAHQRAHGFFEAGDAEAGAAFIEAWLPGYERAGQLHCHLSWHLALFELALGNADSARAIYFDNIRPSVALSAPMLSLADSASFLWRWQLYGAGSPTEQAWTEVVEHARRHFPRAGLAFADLHAGIAEAAIGDNVGLGARIEGLRGLNEQDRLPPGKVAPSLCAGIGALARGDNAAAAPVLETALTDLPRIGGSHAQRELFEDSLIVAYLRSRQLGKAAPLLRARLARRPSSRDQAWLAQCR